MLDYFDRAAPRRAEPEFVEFTFIPLIEPAPGSNCPDGIDGADCSAVSLRFLVLLSALDFALSLALALVICFSLLH